MRPRQRSDLVLVKIGAVKFWFLVPLVDRRRCRSGGALFLFFPGCRRQGRIVQHSAMADDPRRLDSCGRRQRLVALRRAIRCRSRCSPAIGNPRGSVRAVLLSAPDYPPRFSLSGRLRSITRTFQEFECFIVAAALKIVGQLRIHWLRKRRL